MVTGQPKGTSDAVHDDQARAYDAHGRQMFAAGQYLQAAASFTMAAELFRERVDAGDAQASLQYASQLNNAGMCMAKLGRHAVAVEHFGEAASIVEPHWSSDPRGLASFYAGILAALAASMNEVGEHERAIELTAQALPLRRAAAETSGRAVDPHLATTLHQYARARTMAGRDLTRALPAATEAVALLQALAASRPGDDTELRAAYDVLASALEQLGRTEEAADVRSWLMA